MDIIKRMNGSSWFCAIVDGDFDGSTQYLQMTSQLTKLLPSVKSTSSKIKELTDALLI